MVNKIFSVGGYLEQLKSAYDKLRTDGKTGALVGRLTSKNFTDADIEEFKATVQGIIPTIARGIFGEVGVLTDNDIKQYAGAIGGVSTPEEGFDIIFGNMIDNVINKATITLKVGASNGKNVSGFADDYEAFVNRVGAIAGRDPLQKSSNVMLYSNLDNMKSQLDAESYNSFFIDTLLPYAESNGKMSVEDAFTVLKGIKEQSILMPEGAQDFKNEGSGSNNASTVEEALPEPVAKAEDGEAGGQCGRFVNNATGLGVGDTFESKMNKMDPSIKKPEPGMVFTMPYKDSGHCGFIVEVKGDKVVVKDSNWGLDEKVETHEIPLSKISGLKRV